MTHQFDPKMYRIEGSDKGNYFVIAYSEVHAIVELVNMHFKNGYLAFAGEYDVKDVHLVSKKEMKNIIIDYNYVKDVTEQESLLDAFKELTKFKKDKLHFYGVVSDDFVDYY
jgi:GDP-D-mannose dehydratase